ncbi:MAG TPA: hypothetical protein VMQ76_09615 [Terracidiphilus sp.]|nr:hypothetical protein [Terracidiphilus sp.]
MKRISAAPSVSSAGSAPATGSFDVDTNRVAEDFGFDVRNRLSDSWRESIDGDPEARSIFHRHYSFRSYADGRKPKLFIGPGSKIVLVTPDNRALFVWRKFKSGDGQNGINCSVFRNESDRLSSDLIREAEEIAWRVWPNERFFTYVNPRKVKSANPGYCFKCAGWNLCGVTKWNKLLIFEKLP